MTGTRDSAEPVPPLGGVVLAGEVVLAVGVVLAEGAVLALVAPAVAATCGAAPGAALGVIAAPAVAAFASTMAPVIKAAGAAADRILAFLRILPPLFASV